LKNWTHQNRCELALVGLPSWRIVFQPRHEVLYFPHPFSQLADLGFELS
jgi:hypothetical protein